MEDADSYKQVVRNKVINISEILRVNYLYIFLYLFSPILKSTIWLENKLKF
jgi:hypothetical protein